MPSRTVKRVSKSRSNNKPARPKHKGPTASSRAVSETVVTSQSQAVSQTEVAASVLAPAITAVPTAPVVPAAPVASAPASVARVVLGASCTIHEASALRAHLLEKAAHPGPYEIDGSAVQQIDTAGVQLVVAFALDCLERGIHYVWTGRSPVLEEATRTLGVNALLESPGAATNYSVPGAA